MKMEGAGAAGRTDRARGCLAGQLAGDALGSLVEFESAGAVERRYPGGPRLLLDGGTWDTIAGQPTDDSELALALARALARLGRYEEEAAARAYAEWYASGPFDVGGTIATALSAAAAARRGADASSAARAAANAGSQANGALMRISPLGILGARLEPAELAGWARADARLTHPHEVCQEANVVYTGAIAFAIRSGAPRERVYAHAVETLRAQGGGDTVLQWLQEAESRAPEACDGKNQGWVRIALQNAFYQLLHAGSLEEAVVDTARRGGDADTNGAIAGALAGAAWGLREVPRQWLQCLLECRPEKGRAKVRRPRPPEYWPVDFAELAVQLAEGGGHSC